MKAEAERLAMQPGFEKLTAERLAALLVGRWPSGAPVNRVADAANEKMGDNSYANNHFRFDSDTPALKLVAGAEDPFSQTAKADPVGVTCPWAAHIRKVNVRDSASDMGGTIATYNRRILRVGVPFGDSLEDRYATDAQDSNAGNRGLLFLSIQTSIEEQFEFLQARWMNDPSRPKMPGGHDMIVGQNAAVPDGIRRCVIFGEDFAQAEVKAALQFVVPTGGGYFFVPSISALKELVV
jgi:deferrochelatase/peroxidase EfeB